MSLFFDFLLKSETKREVCPVKIFLLFAGLAKMWQKTDIKQKRSDSTRAWRSDITATI